MRLHSIISLVGGIGAAAARQAADLALPSVAAYESYGCRKDCQEAMEYAGRLDLSAVGANFDYPFYATASNFSTKQTPGEILKFETVNANNRSVRAGTTLFRIQYTSRDLDGSIVPATAFVALPQANFRQQGGKFPVVAFGHGTMGVFAGCAPSNGPDLYDYSTWQPLVQRGYAVIASDYAGLGNNFTSHKYLSHLAHANDIYFSVKAARTVLGRYLTEEWMSAGHSQGGGAVWKLAESHLVRNDTKYLGTVAMSPATYIVDMFLNNVGNPKLPAQVAYASFFPFALKRAIPSLKGTFVGPGMRKRLEMADKMQVCAEGMFYLSTGLNDTEVLDKSWVKDNFHAIEGWQNNNTAALGDASPAPVLVVQGTSDTTVLPNTTVQAWDRSCAAGNQVHLRLYQDQDHSATPQSAEAEWLGWIDDMFYNRWALNETKGCSKKTRLLFAGKNTKNPAEGS